MFITSLCDLLDDIPSFASRDEGPVSLSSETNISVKSETVQPVQNFPDVHQRRDGAADYLTIRPATRKGYGSGYPKQSQN